MLVALPLKQGQFPSRGLTSGQKVLIVSTPGVNAMATGSSGSSAASSASSGPSAGGVGVDATVADIWLGERRNPDHGDRRPGGRC
jgi:hypothetical protein